MGLTCSQVGSLMTFYVNGKLDDSLREMFEAHLKSCPTCYRKFQTFLEIMSKFSKVKEYIDSIELEYIDDNTFEYDDFEQDEFNDEFESDENKYVLVQNLSAYSDNELSYEDSLKVKKYIVSNLSARKTLEDICELRKILKHSFEKTSFQIKNDFTKRVMKNLDLKLELKRGGSKLKVASVFIFLITSITLGIIYLFSSLLI